MIKKQFTLYLPNKPGALASVTRAMATEKINIEGISVATTPDVGLVQIVVSHATATRKLLKSRDIAFTVQDVLVVELTNEPGALATVAQRLAGQGININYVYATGCTCRGKGGCKCQAIISGPDLKKVEAAWKAQ